VSLIPGANGKKATPFLLAQLLSVTDEISIKQRLIRPSWFIINIFCMLIKKYQKTTHDATYYLFFIKTNIKQQWVQKHDYPNIFQNTHGALDLIKFRYDDNQHHK
jgi:hypothetical protein